MTCYLCQPWLLMISALTFRRSKCGDEIKHVCRATRRLSLDALTEYEKIESQPNHLRVLEPTLCNGEKQADIGDRAHMLNISALSGLGARSADMASMTTLLRNLKWTPARTRQVHGRKNKIE